MTCSLLCQTARSDAWLNTVLRQARCWCHSHLSLWHPCTAPYTATGHSQSYGCCYRRQQTGLLQQCVVWNVASEHKHATSCAEHLAWIVVWAFVVIFTGCLLANTFYLCLIIWKTLHTAHPPYLSKLITHYFPPRASRSSNTNLLARPSGTTNNFTPRAFSVSTPSTWNSLPTHIRSLDKLSTFKRQLKSHLLQSIYAI